MDEMDHDSKPKRGKGTPNAEFRVGDPKVLRAMDVIPPFDKSARPREDGMEIPSYDLAENILAEQRRAAGRRRRGPGRVEDEPAAPAPVGAKNLSPLLASQDLLELQRVVAEIVARDIERLCRRPDRSCLPAARSSCVGLS